MWEIVLCFFASSEPLHHCPSLALSSFTARFTDCLMVLWEAVEKVSVSGFQFPTLKLQGLFKSLEVTLSCSPVARKGQQSMSSNFPRALSTFRTPCPLSLKDIRILPATPVYFPPQYCTSLLICKALRIRHLLLWLAH